MRIFPCKGKIPPKEDYMVHSKQYCTRMRKTRDKRKQNKIILHGQEIKIKIKKKLKVGKLTVETCFV